MIAWRKLQAGLKGAAKPQEAASQIAQTTTTIIQKNPGEALPDASLYIRGKVLMATAIEINTAYGSVNSALAINPQGFNDSNYGVVIFSTLVEEGSASISTGDAYNGNYFRIPSVCNGWNIVAVAAQVYVVGSTGTTSIQLLNVTDSVNVLSTNLTIDSGEKDSLTAATAAVINTANDDVATGDQFTWHIKGIQSVTAPKGLYCEAFVRRP